MSVRDLDRKVAEKSMTPSSVASSRLNVNTTSTRKSILLPLYIQGSNLYPRLPTYHVPSSRHPSTTNRTITYHTPGPGGGGGLHVLDEHLELLHVPHLAVVVINAVFLLVIEQGASFSSVAKDSDLPNS